MFEHKRKARQEQFKQVRQATHTKAAQSLNWNLSRPHGGARKVNRQTAGMEAVQMVREVVASFAWPTEPKLTYAGLRRTTAGLDAKQADNGVITVTGTVRTSTGVTLGFDVPVEIRNGHLLEPVLFFHNDTPVVLSQSGVDSMIKNATTYGEMPIRTQYAPPLTKGELAARQSPRMERRTPGMFHSASQQLREFVRSGGHKNLGDLAKTADAHEAQKAPWEFALPQGTPTPNTERGLSPEPSPSKPSVGHDPSDPLAPGRPEGGFCPGCYRDVPADAQFAPFCSAKCFAQSRKAPGRMAPLPPKVSMARDHINRQAQMQSEDPGVHLYEPSKRPSKDQLNEEDTIDGAEREPEKISMPGARVRVNKKLSAPTRGGTREIINSGTTGTVIRDQAGDGVNIYVELDDGRKALIPAKHLTGSKKKKAQRQPGASAVCPIHNYTLGQCPTCDGDPREMLKYYEQHPEEVDAVVGPVLEYQKRRLSNFQ
jgi:hypothetical protein